MHVRVCAYVHTWYRQTDIHACICIPRDKERARERECETMRGNKRHICTVQVRSFVEGFYSVIPEDLMETFNEVHVHAALTRIIALDCTQIFP